MSLQKTNSEIKNIERACKITDEIFSQVVSNFFFKTERELALYIRKEIKKRGLREAFPPIVTCGARAGNEIHPKYTDELLEGFVIIDFGVRVNGYCSDMTRTLFVGVPTKKDKDTYAKILSAKKAGEKMVRHDNMCALADKASRTALGALSKYFIHTLGHGVGRRIHELPRIYHKREKDVFLENMIVTVEPGIYIPGKLGIRIEDTYLVTKKGAIPLSKSPQKLMIFPKMH